MPRFYRFWLLYFLFMIGLVGSVFAYFLATPFWLLGFVFLPARSVGDGFLCFGVRVLLDLEPWLDADLRIDRPKRGLTVANHRSHLDVFLLLSRIPGLRVVSKDGLFQVPFLGFIMRMMRQICVKGGDSASYLKGMEEVRQALRNGEAVHVFPETTRAPLGFRGTQDFRLTAFHIAIQEKAPILPIAIAGTDRVWPKGVFGLSFREKVRVRSLPPIASTDFKSATDLASEVRRRINMELEWMEKENESAHLSLHPRLQ